MGCPGTRNAASEFVSLALAVLYICASVASCEATVQAREAMVDFAKQPLPNLLGGQPFYEASNAQIQPPGPLYGSLKAPLPTNQWFTNLVTGQGDQPVYPYPYIVAARNKGIAMDYSDPPEVTPTAVTYSFAESLSFGFLEDSQPRVLTRFDSLSATMQWTAVGSPASFEATIFRGSPYQTVTYDGLKPNVSTVHEILSINGEPVAAGSTVKGSRIELKLRNEQSWIIYATAPLELQVGPLTTSGTTLTSLQSFSGVVRAALAPSPAAIAVLDSCKDIVPTQGNIDYTVGADRARVSFTYQTQDSTIAKNSKESLLICVLPHHIDAGATGTVLLQKIYNTMKGAMTCLAIPRLSSGTYGWEIVEDLTTINFDAPRPIAVEKKASVVAALAVDAGLQADAPDVYFFGKQIAALGRLALIADSLGEDSTAVTIRDKMKLQLEPYLSGTNPNPFRFDTKYGGITTETGLIDGRADYGSGLYNDHHFHWGYYIYAAAAVGQRDAAWLSAKQAPLDALLRDFANPLSNDTFLPFARNKDWFDGHSWASGVTPFAAGKNQESSSEAVNAYYAVHLIGEARGDNSLSDWGRLLLATELRSAKKYYQINPGQQGVYPPDFAKNGVVGVLWSGLASYSTWFGNNVEYIYGIQMLPFTPISEELLQPDWLGSSYPILAKALGNAEQGWKGFIYMANAVIDKAAAWDEAQSLVSFDNGNSRTNTLWWVATRP